jgi:hypothetical protein
MIGYRLILGTGTDMLVPLNLALCLKESEASRRVTSVWPNVDFPADEVNSHHAWRHRHRTSRPKLLLLGAIQPIPGIAQAGDDIAVRVEALVDGRGVYRHVRMLLLHAGNAFRSRQ